MRPGWRPACGPETTRGPRASVSLPLDPPVWGVPVHRISPHPRQRGGWGPAGAFEIHWRAVLSVRRLREELPGQASHLGPKRRDVPHCATECADHEAAVVLPQDGIGYRLGVPAPRPRTPGASPGASIEEDERPADELAAQMGMQVPMLAINSDDHPTPQRPILSVPRRSGQRTQHGACHDWSIREASPGAEFCRGCGRTGRQSGTNLAIAGPGWPVRGQPGTAPIARSEGPRTARLVRQEVRGQGRAGAGEGPHVGAAAGPGGRDDVALAVAVDVTDRDPDTAGEAGGVGEEAHAGIAPVAREHAHVRAAAGAGAGDDLRAAEQCPATDIDPTGEAHRIGEEAREVREPTAR